MTKAIFPGSFDPLTKGHLDLIKRASKMFDEVVVTVAKNTSKNGVFSYDERMSLIKPNIEGIKNVSVTSADGLTVDLAEQVGATVIVRGLRNSSDFNAESSIASMNYNLDNTIESVFLITRPEFQSVSSSLIKEIAHFGGDITPYVPQNVATALKEKLS
ncbi:pantetheine-phosphate adenylyltransferase [Apilactobacillus kunkeei]|uniref:Phosphopantetheine adenylyltransferase n=1 Tax=Apilactobacillus kunkeei DSM 12361 = ATCC 700308 TaxID=1423768 RepID=A0A0R1FRL7_9LACO|nr:pantetheine-phosphate adenylyltransferase [Apilactobacillus kunkeei]KOY69492.1 Phosphopantetheine adenylyltransferase [Apilactobacillus kunkeei]KOY73155.1 Phosphopantetheine adenylyltransferase [Apilactobacillus kunkeei DSM 12361 = ATCC 700308]KRK24590.1 Phosphopantetheine adenylyltransferase [Apilactobacillus kunkeei DSM 12361 = ATCC 700308]MCK8619711.1 pantetheine-phosphate adenylyltransferase [Apilactobacillus kunkeei]MCK8626030.1 pantetheine-phosphate adenylyltransferase [Apilactobacill